MKDFKPRPKVKHTSVGNTLIGIFIGLMLGLLMAAAVAIYMMKSPLPWSSKPKGADKSLSESRAEGGSTTPSADPSRSGTAGQQAKGTINEAPAGKAATAAGAEGDKPRFDFYKILPGKEDAPAPSAVGAASPRSARPAEAVAPVEHFILQAGAFQDPADADAVKARLALLGLEAGIETVDLPDRGTWYRVRLGPYANLAEVNHVRSQLAQNGIDVSLVRNVPPR